MEGAHRDDGHRQEHQPHPHALDRHTVVPRTLRLCVAKSVKDREGEGGRKSKWGGERIAAHVSTNTRSDDTLHARQPARPHPSCVPTRSTTRLAGAVHQDSSEPGSHKKQPRQPNRGCVANGGTSVRGGEGKKASPSATKQEQCATFHFLTP